MHDQAGAPPIDRGRAAAASILDGLLELSVVASFSRIGPAVRRRLDAWTDAPADALRDRTVVITGPTSGLGKALAVRLADLGARIVLVGRSSEKLDGLSTELASRAGDDRFPTVVADLGSIGAVRRAVDEIRRSERRVDVLVDNAGAIHR